MIRLSLEKNISNIPTSMRTSKSLKNLNMPLGSKREIFENISHQLFTVKIYKKLQIDKKRLLGKGKYKS